MINKGKLPGDRWKTSLGEKALRCAFYPECEWWDRSYKWYGSDL